MSKKERLKRENFKEALHHFGYKKDKENKNHLIIDESTAPLIRRIFDLYLLGNGIDKISKILNKEEIPSPRETSKIKKI